MLWRCTKKASHQYGFRFTTTTGPESAVAYIVVGDKRRKPSNSGAYFIEDLVKFRISLQAPAALIFVERGHGDGTSTRQSRRRIQLLLRLGKLAC